MHYSDPVDREPTGPADVCSGEDDTVIPSFLS